MIIGCCTLEFHLPHAGSLKAKRVFIRRFKDRLSGRFNVAVAEVDHQDLWQRCVVGVVSISNRKDAVDRTLQAILREAERQADGHLVSFHMEFM